MEPFRGVYRPTDMWRSVLLGVVLAGVLAGCSLGGESGAGSAVTAQARATGGDVTAHGMIVRVGGPNAGATAIPGAELRFVGSQRSVTVRAEARGRFALDVAPGSYRVKVTGHAPTANGVFLATVPDTIVVPVGGPDRPFRLIVSIK